MSISDHALAVEAAEVGAAVVRAYHGMSLTHFDKGGGDFATTADVEAEKEIVGVLRAARPADVVVGEESGRTGGAGERAYVAGRSVVRDAELRREDHAGLRQRGFAGGRADHCVGVGGGGSVHR
jgi:3'-phosphoadenosine 5'-phosphosulfate (PAPS) 3'-phosphatase